MLVSAFAYIWIASAQIVNAQTLEHALTEPAAIAYQQQLNQIAQRGTYQNELRPLVRDPLLQPAAKEWLIAQSLQILQQQSPSAAAKAYVSELTGFSSTVQLTEDFEGRLRNIPLTQIAQNAQYTLRWWQTQEYTQALMPTLALTDWSELNHTWHSLSSEKQRAYELAVKNLSPSMPLNITEATFSRLIHTAPALAVAITDHEQSSTKLQQLFSTSGHPSVVEYIHQLPAWLNANTAAQTLLAAANKNAPLKSLLLSKMTERAPNEARLALWKAAQHGDQEALFALSQLQGDALIPELRTLWNINDTKASALVITGLRFINSANAEYELQQLAQQKNLPRSLTKELAPWK